MLCNDKMCRSTRLKFSGTLPGSFRIVEGFRYFVVGPAIEKFRDQTVERVLQSVVIDISHEARQGGGYARQKRIKPVANVVMVHAETHCAMEVCGQPRDLGVGVSKLTLQATHFLAQVGNVASQVFEYACSKAGRVRAFKNLSACNDRIKSAVRAKGDDSPLDPVGYSLFAHLAHAGKLSGSHPHAYKICWIKRQHLCRT